MNRFNFFLILSTYVFLVIGMIVEQTTAAIICNAATVGCLCFACYFVGRARGVQEGAEIALDFFKEVSK